MEDTMRRLAVTEPGMGTAGRYTPGSRGHDNDGIYCTGGRCCTCFKHGRCYRE